MEPDRPAAASGLPLPPDEAPAPPPTASPPESPMPPIAPVHDPVATARRRYGAGGAIVAAGMLGIDQVLGRRAKEEAPIVVAASDQPVDIDTDGITVPVDESTEVVAPPQPRPDPFPRRPRRRRR